MSSDFAAAVDPSAAPRSEPTRAWLWTNVVVTQVAWFACVLGAARGLPWVGTACVALIVAGHLLRAPRPVAELRLIAAAVLFGLAFDSALLATGAVAYPNGQWSPAVSPHWMLALWAAFAASLNVSMRWLKRRTLLAAVLGAVVGPISYASGARLGAAELLDRPLALACLSVGWAVAMPLLMAWSERYDGVAPRRESQPLLEPAR